MSLDDDFLKVVDLHGLDQQDALGKIINLLFDLENSDDQKVLVITGRGYGVLKQTLEQILDEQDYYYEIQNNGGAYLIYAKHEKTFDFDLIEDYE
ncbi:Smr/MutS family protein [Mycoplasmopsis pulmonis]|nr:Smr/MutS family protein [Mycoplasmopsis pulmonis]MDZ7293585.1 Smr/MutS family protein [Mycoplasmopsis pulmonis]VEU68375.1 Smr domain [Mycoplasmopsis pulmonis]